jgi:aminomethyltransferase
LTTEFLPPPIAERLMSTTDLLRTPLYDWHVAHGGRMVDFAGWSMPVQYTSIAEEHNATRNAVGVFDISHMGRLAFFGPHAAEFLDSIVTRRVNDMKRDQIRYALVCDESGGILDDVLVYGRSSSGDSHFTMVVNAGNREKIVRWIEDRIARWRQEHADLDEITLVDETFEYAMVAVQGPHALRVFEASFAMDVSRLRYYHFTRTAGMLVSRTGYTGEDGFELICQADRSTDIWRILMKCADDVGGKAAALGARDTLRLEAAMPLYGHELSEAVNPFQAGLAFAVNLAGRDFVGREALERFATDKSQPVRVGLQAEGKRVPRQGCPVLQENDVVGEVTSGTFSPTLNRAIAMAYVRPTAKDVGTKLTIDIRSTQHEATVVPLPFYKRRKQD